MIAFTFQGHQRKECLEYSSRNSLDNLQSPALDDENTVEIQLNKSDESKSIT